MCNTNTYARPSLPPKSHPVERGKYIIPTPPIRGLWKSLKVCLDDDTPGVIVQGPPGTGKTKAAKMITKKAEEEWGETLPVVMFEVERRKLFSEKEFFTNILSDLNHGLADSGQPGRKRDRVVDFLVQKTMKERCERIIIIVDEAHNLNTDDHFDCLVSITNKLELRGIDPMFILVGEPQLVNKRTAFINADKQRYVRRYMLDIINFFGLRNKVDVKSCLAAYDLKTEYPKESGFSYTRYFFPAAFSQNWRLENCAETVWKAFQDIREEYHLPTSDEIPMRYFARTVNHVLRKHQSLNDEVIISLNQWKEGVKSSRYHTTRHCYANK